MRKVCVALFLALGLSTASTAVAFDDLDDLLAISPAVSTTPGEFETADTYAELEVRDPAVPTTGQWDPAQGTVATVLADADDNGPSGLSVVPEPSAIALAGLAAVYFLIFCRRRFSI